MPYEGEFAHYQPLRRIVESERVKELLRGYRVRSRTDNEDDSEQGIVIMSAQISSWIPKWVLAIDGSHAEVKVENGFPGAEASYITVASVVVNLSKVIELDQARPSDPKEYRKTENTDAIDCALPGSNVINAEESSAHDSFRKALFDLFGSVQIAETGESLLDTYEALLQYKPANHGQICPCEECPDPEKGYKPERRVYDCQCSLANRVYSTDALRIHEDMAPIGSNGAMFAEVMQVLERLWLVHILRTFEANKWLASLNGFAFVIDGPLAVFGHPAWLSKAIGQELIRINSLVKKVTGHDLLIIGIEKTGAFVEHFAYIDQNSDGSEGRFPKQSVALLNDGYIKKNIVFSEGTKLYGQDTYFGRKFFYKTKSDARIVGMVPFLEEEQRDIRNVDPTLYPRLSDTLGLLDRLVSSRYPNALSPLVSANAEAAIPLHMGNRVLEQLAKELMKEGQK